jgi:thioredoxin reductase
MKRYRICIIGGGASGLAAARVFASEDYQYEPTVFEQNPFIGGQWNYDPDGTSESTAVYKNLKTNLPCSVMQFSDFPFPNNHPESYVSLKEMQEYLIAYTEKYQLMKYILLNTKVNSIDETFTVIYTVQMKLDSELPKRVNQNLIEKNENYAVYSEQFDAICVANGHYSEMYIPSDIPGLNEHTFRIIHSRSYREPEPYRDQCIIVVGGSHSGIDICGELASIAKQVILSIKEENIDHFHGVLNLLRQSEKQLCTDYSSTTFSIAPPIDYIDKDTVYFKNQTSVKPDLMIFATGYDYRMPFLQGKLQVDLNRLLQNRYVYPLYKQLFHANFPDGTLSFLTIPYRIVPFPLAEIQSHLIARVLAGKISLPSQEKMINEIDQSIVSPNHSYHCVNMITYTESLLEIMNESNQYFNYKFVIDNQRRVRQIVK